MAKKAAKVKAAEPAGPAVPTLAAHPRATRDLLRARGWGALAGFVLVALLASRAGLAWPDVLLRALVGGSVGLLAGWTACLVVWRAVAAAEIRAAALRYETARQRRAEAAAEQAAAA